MLAALELEDRGEELRAEALLLEALRDGVDRRDLILEIGVADDDPRVAELVLAALELRAGVGGDTVEQLLEVVLGADEVAGRERLEARLPPAPARAQARARCRSVTAAVVSANSRSRAGPASFFLPKRTFAQAHEASAEVDRAAHLRAISASACEPLLERRVRHEELARRALFTDVGMMKNAFIPSTSRRSRCGIRNMSLAIFCSALIRCSGAPVISAEPRSAANSR